MITARYGKANLSTDDLLKYMMRWEVLPKCTHLSTLYPPKYIIRWEIVNLPAGWSSRIKSI